MVYSYRVAGTVGLMMSKILKVNNREALKGAIDLGIAMQLLILLVMFVKIKLEIDNMLNMIFINSRNNR